jgi:uncharacterized protein (TIGR00299 family) protein
MEKMAYLDCSSGVSGDMMLAVLVDVGVPLDVLNAAIRSLGLPGCNVRTEEVKKDGFRARQITVDYEHEHVHRHLHQILAMVEGGQISDRAKKIATHIFTRLAEAEAKVHGIAVEKVHFHEVGAADSIADIVGTAVAWDFFGDPRLIVSPVPTGSGKIRIAHGECSIPAPATAELLRGVPLAATVSEGELTTPTGAAIVTALAAGFGPLPAMKIDQIGYGCGHKEFAHRPNIMRLLVGEAVEAHSAESDRICVLETNLDDTPGEIVGYCIERLWQRGALDVFTTAIQMKKNRPGVMLTVLCPPADVSAFEEILIRETSTLGVRRSTIARTKLQRKPHRVTTPWGEVDGKLSWSQNHPPRFAPEYESCRRIAQEKDIPLCDVYQAAVQAFDANSNP